MTGPAATPGPPYYAVIFTSVLGEDTEGYEAAAERMVALASRQDGFLGVESARAGLGITVSYWRDLESIRAWREHAEHAEVRRIGRERWYRAFRLRVCLVEREYGSG